MYVCTYVHTYIRMYLTHNSNSIHPHEEQMKKTYSNKVTRMARCQDRGGLVHVLPVILLQEGPSVRLSKMALPANKIYQVLVTDLFKAG